MVDTFSLRQTLHSSNCTARTHVKASGPFEDTMGRCALLRVCTGVENVKAEGIVAARCITFEKQLIHPFRNIRSKYSHSCHESAGARTSQDTKAAPIQDTVASSQSNTQCPRCTSHKSAVPNCSSCRCRCRKIVDQLHTRHTQSPECFHRHACVCRLTHRRPAANICRRPAAGRRNACRRAGQGDKNRLKKKKLRKKFS